MPIHCIEELRHYLICLYYDEAVYDYLAALQGNITASLAGAPQKLIIADYTLKTSGVAYYHNVPTELDVSGFTEHLLQKIEDDLSGLEWADEVYGCITSVQGDLNSDVDPTLFSSEDFIITAAGNTLNKCYGPVPALPYEAEECSMPLDCLATMGNYYNEIPWAQERYELSVEQRDFVHGHKLLSKYLPMVAKYGMTMDCVVATVTYHGGLEIEEEYYLDAMEKHAVTSGYVDFPDTFSTEMEQRTGSEVVGSFWYILMSDDILGPGAWSSRVQNVDPKEFMGRLESVDISTVLAEDMKCLHCWNQFGETDVDTVEFRVGEVKLDDNPVKLPCDHGHLIGKTCSMQLIDADDHLCPVRRQDIVATVG
ncbi:hypothetical protein BU25DRAFT_460912 [Macroventuria anomochaeta]|uniref:Uncharacterized protein n=1 Tax=Macroventuria anomochaeta TaxID=301207 RepID=A0ACB6RRS0_9PLEO|nr:uncharacterized protein BU25DRAFT_460912 [Macroventuria anomochaeta]KAF2624741.1 hypothetical protein BU25DRAFT_460912 [Macroventuria anomochaeta]